MHDIPLTLLLLCKETSTLYLIRTNFGVEKIWRNWRFWSQIAKLSPRQKWLFFRHRQIKSTPNLFFSLLRQIKSTPNLFFYGSAAF